MVSLNKKGAHTLNPNDWLSVSEVAALCAITESAVIRRLSRGDIIPHKRCRGRIYFDRAAFDASDWKLRRR